MSEDRKRSRFDALGWIVALPDELVIVAVIAAAVAVVALSVWFVMRVVARTPKAVVTLPRAIARRRPRNRVAGAGIQAM